MKLIKTIMLFFSLLSVSGESFADCCKTKKKDGSPDKCTNRAVIVLAPKADGMCLIIGDLYTADDKKVQFKRDQVCPDCGHYVFEHNCDEKNKYKNKDEASSDAWAAKNSKVKILGPCS